MDLAEFAALDDFEKLVIVEVELSRKLEEETWDQHGDPGSDAWRVAMPSDGEVHKVVLDGTELTEKFSVSGCHGTASTFYYDDLAKELYVHTTDSDDPATLDGSVPKYSIVAYFDEFFSNRAKTLEPFEDLLAEKNGGLEYWTTSTNAEDVTESVSGASTVEQSSATTGGDHSAYSAKITIDGSANAAYIQWAFSTMGRRKHRVRLKYRATGAAYVYIFDSGTNVYLNTSGGWEASGSCISLPGTGGAWVEKELEFVTHASYNDYIIRIRCATASAVVYIDDVELHRHRREVECKPYLGDNAIPSVYQGVGDYYQPDEQIEFGTVRFINDGWFWDRKTDDSYLWHNRKVKMWVGKLSEDYGDLAAFGVMFTRKPRFGDVVEIDVEDERILLRKLPPDDKRFDSTAYPNCEDEWVNRPIPVLLGHVKGITPPECNTATFVYKVTRTVFSSTFNQYSLDAVYKDGVLQTEGGGDDYTVDLTAGTFTMNNDPGSAEITCDAKGIEYDPITGLGYNFTMVDLLYFIFVECNDISQYDMDMKSLVDFYANRTPVTAWWLADERDSIDFLIMCKRSALYQSYVSLEGKHLFIPYTSDVPSTAPHFYNYDYLDEPRLTEDTEQCYKTVACRSQYHPDLANYLYEEEDSEDNTEREHGVKERLVVDTILYMQTQAGTLATNYLKMLKDPIEILTVTLKNPAALLLNPTDKAYFSYTRTDVDGNEISVKDEVAYRILSLEKNLNDCTTRIRAIPDLADFHWTFP